MSSFLTTTKQLTSDKKWEVTAEVVPGGTLPLDIFMYSYTGGDTVAEYQGVTQLDDYHRVKTFTGTPMPVFGNKYVKTNQAKILIDIDGDPDLALSVIEQDVKALSVTLNNSGPVTKTIPIP